MTSRQVKLTPRTRRAHGAWLLGVVLASLVGSGCHSFGPGDKPELVAPHPPPQVWAVAPMLNESGSLHVDTLRLSDQLTAHLERVDGLDVLPLNRVLATMEAIELDAVTTTSEAMALRRALNIDAVVVGTVSAYDPYDPPKLGLIVELYLGDRDPIYGVDIRHLSRAAVDQDARPYQDPRRHRPTQPVTRVSAHLDAADPATRRALDAYGKQHSVTRGDRTRTGVFTEYDPIGARLYRISTDRYGDFATFQVVRRLIDAEALRLAPPPPPTGDEPVATADNVDPSPDG